MLFAFKLLQIDIFLLCIHLRNKLVCLNTGLIRTVLNRNYFQYRKTPTEDLFNIGVQALIRAIERYEPGFNYKLSTYAIACIAGEIHHYLRDKDELIRPSRGKQPYRVLSYNVKPYNSDTEFLDVIPGIENPENVTLFRFEVESFSEQSREIITLRIAGYSYKEIALQVGLSSTTVSKNYKSSLDKLRLALI